MNEAPLGAEELVLALGIDDEWLHAGTLAEMLEHAAAHRDSDEAAHRVDFFDGAGKALEPLAGDDLVVYGFRRAGGPAEPALVKRRVDAVLDRAEAYLAAHPGGPGQGYPAHMTVPRPEGSLEEVVGALRLEMLLNMSGHAAGWFHNLIHALGG